MPVQQRLEGLFRDPRWAIQHLGLGDHAEPALLVLRHVVRPHHGVGGALFLGGPEQQAAALGQLGQPRLERGGLRFESRQFEEVAPHPFVLPVLDELHLLESTKAHIAKIPQVFLHEAGQEYEFGGPRGEVQRYEAAEPFRLTLLESLEPSAKNPWALALVVGKRAADPVVVDNDPHSGRQAGRPAMRCIVCGVLAVLGDVDALFDGGADPNKGLVEKVRLGGVVRLAFARAVEHHLA